MEQKTQSLGHSFLKWYENNPKLQKKILKVMEKVNEEVNNKRTTG